MTRLTDLSNVALPAVVRPLSIETILNEMIAEFNRIDPSFSEALQNEGEPVRIAFQVFAYREFLQRQTINDSARAIFLATSTGRDLDNLAVFWGLARRSSTPAGSTEVTLESDDNFRLRILNSSAALSVAGSQSAYEAKAIEANTLVFRAAARRTAPGAVTVTLLPLISQMASVIDQAVRTQVANYLRERSPMTDTVTVETASIVDVSINATITIYPGPDPTTVSNQIKSNLEQLSKDRYVIGQDLALNVILGAMYISGVTHNIVLTSPSADLTANQSQAIKINASGATLTVNVVS